MISESYFYIQAMRLREARRWFGILKEALLDDVEKYEDSLKDFTGAWPPLAGKYKTRVNSDDTESFAIENGSVKLELQANNPIGWITVVKTKRFGFEENPSRGAVSAEWVAASGLINEPDTYTIKAIGILKGLTTVREVADKLCDALYDSDLVEADCVFQDNERSQR